MCALLLLHKAGNDAWPTCGDPLRCTICDHLCLPFGPQLLQGWSGSFWWTRQHEAGEPGLQHCLLVSRQGLWRCSGLSWGLCSWDPSSSKSQAWSWCCTGLWHCIGLVGSLSSPKVSRHGLDWCQCCLAVLHRI